MNEKTIMRKGSETDNSFNLCVHANVNVCVIITQARTVKTVNELPKYLVIQPLQPECLPEPQPLEGIERYLFLKCLRDVKYYIGVVSKMILRAVSKLPYTDTWYYHNIVKK